jgi:hypothetical protein
MTFVAPGGAGRKLKILSGQMHGSVNERHRGEDEWTAKEFEEIQVR